MTREESRAAVTRETLEACGVVGLEGISFERLTVEEHDAVRQWAAGHGEKPDFLSSKITRSR